MIQPINHGKHRVTIPCKWSFEKRRFSRKVVLFTNGLPSVLYETPGLNERSVLNQLFLLVGLSKERPILGDNRKAHSEKRCAFHEKRCAFHEKQH